MHDYLFKIELQNSKKKINLRTPAILFEENKIHFAFLPALKLTGYGNTQAESIFSLQTVMQEYFNTTTEQNTLEKDLQKIGWKINIKTNKLIAPDFKTLLHIDDKLKDIVYNMPFQKSSVAVAM